MPIAETEWWSLIDALQPGDRVFFAQNRSAACAEVVEGFLRSALARRDLLAVVLPTDEVAPFMIGFDRRGFPLRRFANEGYLHAMPSDEFLPTGSIPGERIPMVLDELATMARRQGHAGISLLAKVAAPHFDRGDQAVAEAIESALHTGKPSTRTLCLYDSKNIYALRIADAVSLLRRHTHSIIAMDSGRLVAESTAGPSESHRTAPESRGTSRGTDA